MKEIINKIKQDLERLQRYIKTLEKEQLKSYEKGYKAGLKEKEQDK
jgi:hypothetical protein